MLHFIATWVFAILDPLVTFPIVLTTSILDGYRRVPASSEPNDITLLSCRYRIDGSNQTNVLLPDSRTISYRQFGSDKPEAKTIFFLHGFPGAAVEAALLDCAAQDLDIRIVGVDRPGTGKSTRHLKRSILSHAQDIEFVAKHLHVERYGVLGVSGGGPYALACAKAHSADKLKVLGIVCGLGPADIGYRGMWFLNYLGWTFASHYTPRLVKWWFSREPAARLDLLPSERMRLLIDNCEKAEHKINPKDRPFFTDKDIMKLQLRCGEDAHANGMDCVYQDMNLLASDPGFDVGDIRKDLRVFLWYGTDDGNVPLNHGKEIANRLRGVDDQGGDERVKLTIREKDTHVSVFLDYRQEILADMVKEI